MRLWGNLWGKEVLVFKSMSVSSPLANFLSSIKNCRSVYVGRKVSVASSRFLSSVAEALKRHNYISDYLVQEVSKGVAVLSVNIKFNKEKNNIVSDIKMISKPGRRIYMNIDELRLARLRDSCRNTFVSTSRGVMSMKSALENGVGGEVLFKVF